jgi:hypothetical protein
MTIKNCKVHGDVSNDDIYIKRYRKNGIWKHTIYCKKCIHAKNAKYYDKKMQNPDYVAKKKELDKKRWLNKKPEITEKRRQPERLAKRRDAYYAKQEYYQEKCSAKQKKYRENLHDSYIRRLIQDGNKELKFAAIPDSLVRFKRTLMQCKKAIKSAQQENLKGKIEENENK